jgi:hypothetical protein
MFLLSTPMMKAAILSTASTPSSTSTRPVVRSELRTWRVIAPICPPGSALRAHEVVVPAIALFVVRIRLQRRLRRR